MRVDDRKANASVKVGERHIIKERRLADACFPEEGDVLPPHRFRNRDCSPVLFAYAEMNRHEIIGLVDALNYRGESYFRLVAVGAVARLPPNYGTKGP